MGLKFKIVTSHYKCALIIIKDGQNTTNPMNGKDYAQWNYTIRFPKLQDRFHILKINHFV